MKISEILKNLVQWHQPYENPKTRDTVKCGNPDTECTGIAVSCCATPEVIRRAADLGCNLLIAHESLYYGDEFSPEAFAGLDAFEAKQKLLDETGIVVFRDHDHMHGKGKPWVPVRLRNDYIYYGFMKIMGWEDYVVGDTMKPLWYQIPETSAGELARELIEKLNLNGMRMLGKEDTRISKVFMAEHCMGKGDDQRIREASGADAIIPLEICDWTVSTYVRDANELGMSKVIFEMGHFNVEEPGMRYMCEWLPEAIQNHDIPIHYLQSEDMFHYIKR
jgi:putative NIF3 family GTP cyclohydrolase 1 type 2